MRRRRSASLPLVSLVVLGEEAVMELVFSCILRSPSDITPLRQVVALAAGAATLTACADPVARRSPAPPTRLFPLPPLLSPHPGWSTLPPPRLGALSHSPRPLPPHS